MKTIIGILILLLTIISFIPCEDIYISDNGPTEELHHNDHHEQEDDCTPLCVCHCCGILIIASKLMDLETIKSLVYFEYSFYYDNHYSLEYLKEIWQPPVV